MKAERTAQRFAPICRLFVAPEQFAGTCARIVGADHNHLSHVLRARPGDTLIVLDGTGRAFSASVTQAGRDGTQVLLGEALQMTPEPVVHITIGQAIGKADKFEQVVQHCTEAGASAYVPLRADRSVADIPADRVAARLDRWRLIAKGAAEQCGRTIIPTVARPATLEEMLATVGPDRPVIMLEPGASAIPFRETLAGLPAQPPTVTLLVGPEGGWSTPEIALSTSMGAMLASLGSRTLRTETAALVAVSQLLFNYE